ncbi:cucumber peeling cupredoxin-like protein [Tanacetum coccineum]
MNQKLNLFIIMVIVAASMEFCGMAAVEHIVGGSFGWDNPNGNVVYYDKWSLNQRFHIGNVLVFNFATGAHTVAEVQAYGLHNTSQIITIGPAYVSLLTGGVHYVICSLKNHSRSGQSMVMKMEEE